MSGPSETTIAAAAKATAMLNREGVGNPGPDFYSTPYARASLVAACDPALGLDRLVPLRDVVEALDNPSPDVAGRHWLPQAAAFIERTFGEANG